MEQGIWALIRDYQTLIVGIPSFIIIIITIILTYKQIRDMRETRYSELFLEAYRIWDSKELVESRQLIMEIVTKNQNLCQKIEEYEKSDATKYLTIIKVGSFFESLGILVKRFIKVELVSDFFRSSILNYYKYYEEWIKKKHDEGETRLFENFEELAKMLKNCN